MTGGRKVQADTWRQAVELDERDWGSPSWTTQIDESAAPDDVDHYVEWLGLYCLRTVWAAGEGGWSCGR